MNGDGGAAGPLDVGVDAEDVAHIDRPDEFHGLYGNSGNASLSALPSTDAGGNIHLGQHPPPENIAARIGIVASSLLGLMIGTALPHMILGRMGKRRVAAFVALFPEAIDLMVRALRSGLPISEAIIGAGQVPQAPRRGEGST